uniref:Xylulose kinase-1 n=1 Tax=Tanacetum cinerariifolium TaxID=118510 RepID=A0A6L2J509_TANCI|nr:hypothetical protein [Tanacetum cinerariifolium]
MVAFLAKPTECEEFQRIIDFMNANPIKYALTVNPTVYTSCIEKFWTTTKANNISEEVQIYAKVDGKKVIISEATIRRDLKFEDEGGVDCLSNEVIFEQLILMGVKRLKKKRRSRTHGLKRLYKVGLSARVKSFAEEQSLGEEDASKQGSNIADIIADAKITLVDETAEDQGRFDDQEMFDTGVLDDEDLLLEKTVAVKEVDAVQDQVSAATTSFAKYLTVDDITLAKALEALKTSKPKIRGIVVIDHKEPSESTTIPTSIADSTRPKPKEEQEQLTDDKKANLFMEFLEKRRKRELKESSLERAEDELEQESAKTQKVNDDQEATELKRCLEIVPDDKDDETIDATPLSSKSLTIIDYKIQGRKSYFQIIRAYGSSQICKLRLLEELMLLVQILQLLKVKTAKGVSAVKEWIKIEDWIKIDWRSRILTR